MINYTTLALPIIAILAIGGVIGVFIMYAYYAVKYEKMVLQISKVEPSNARIPITFNGKNSEVNNFINIYNLTVTTNQKVMYFPKINGSVVTADITKPDLLKIIEHLSLCDVFP